MKLRDILKATKTKPIKICDKLKIPLSTVYLQKKWYNASDL